MLCVFYLTDGWLINAINTLERMLHKYDKWNIYISSSVPKLFVLIPVMYQDSYSEKIKCMIKPLG